ncbi:MAG: hypothetical protein ACR2LE_11010 [Nocardioidaceae bacterium]
MTTTLRTLSATAAGCTTLALALSGCGSDDTPRAGGAEHDAGIPEPSVTSATTEQSPQQGAVSVSLLRTGGLKPVTIQRTFSSTQSPPSGYDSADVEAVLRAANSFERADIQLDRPPGNPCCDQYSFAVTITHADGSSATYRSVGGQRQPHRFDILLQELS